MELRERWQTTWQALGLMPLPALYDEICAAYGEPHRAYHTLQHLEECFLQFDRARHLARHASEIELALWFHDAVYDTRANDSEERSAAWAARSLAAAGAPPDQVERISRLIRATKHTGSHTSDDEAVLLDVDLSILGAPRARFIEYESQVRREYSWVSEAAFRSARRAILARFLERPRIYATAYFVDLLETQARENLRFSIGHLGAEQ